MEWLKETFPESIGALKPLKVGIVKDIQVFDATNKPAMVWCRRALNLHASRKQYISQLIAGAVRVNLDGKACGTVTESEARHAIERLSLLAQLSHKKTQVNALNKKAS